MALTYTGAYCSDNTIYILNEHNSVQTQFKITGGYTAISQPTWAQDGRGGIITILVQSKSNNAKYIMTYNHMGTQCGMHMA
ncbi:MAG: hypothetical protein EBU90_31105 [Proteobacteria bacterium]|nr:hypothetical protein [Pseudomonadota bacterium]NBP17005.1 hypothetical protein [bacterium]